MDFNKTWYPFAGDTCIPRNAATIVTNFSAPEPKVQVHYNCEHTSLTFHIFYFSEIIEQNSMKLDRKQDVNVLYQVCVFRANQKPRLSSWLLIG